MRPFRVDSRSALRFLLAAAMIVGALFVAACGDDEPPPPPTARAFFLYDVTQIPTAEIWANDVKLTNVSAGAQSAQVELATGPTSLEVRAPGASESLAETELTLVEQTYLIAVTGTAADMQFWVVDQQAPAVESGKAAVEVVNLFESAAASKLDVYVGGEAVATGVEPMQVSDFVSVDAGSVNIQLFNEGGQPDTEFAVEEMMATLADGSAYMLLLKNRENSTKPAIELVLVR